MRSLSSSPKPSEALTTNDADTISKVPINSVRYYFEVDNPVGGNDRYFVGRDGKLVLGDSDLSRIRTFATQRAASQFFDLMNGRYGGRPLYQRSNIRKCDL